MRERERETIPHSIVNSSKSLTFGNISMKDQETFSFSAWSLSSLPSADLVIFYDLFGCYSHALKVLSKQ